MQHNTFFIWWKLIIRFINPCLKIVLTPYRSIGVVVLVIYIQNARHNKNIFKLQIFDLSLSQNKQLESTKLSWFGCCLKKNKKKKTNRKNKTQLIMSASRKINSKENFLADACPWRDRNREVYACTHFTKRKSIP